jgi:hypothetical protein
MQEALAKLMGLETGDFRIAKPVGFTITGDTPQTLNELFGPEIEENKPVPLTVHDPLADLLGMDSSEYDVVKPPKSRVVYDREPGPEMLVPVGLCLAAMGVEALGVDLLPGLERVEAISRSPWARAVPAGVAFALVLGGARLLAGANGKKAEADRIWLAANKDRFEELAALREESAVFMGRLKTLGEYGQGSAAYLDFLLALNEALPAGTRLTRISVTDRRVEFIEGTTPSVSILMRRLKADPALARLNLRGQAVSKTLDGQTVEAFALTGPFGEEAAGNETKNQ